MNSLPLQSLESLQGIGPVNAEKLRAAGISSPQQLRDCGTTAAFVQIRTTSDPGACFHLLLGLEAAVQDIPKKHIDQQRRGELRQWFRQLT